MCDTFQSNVKTDERKHLFGGKNVLQLLTVLIWMFEFLFNDSEKEWLCSRYRYRRYISFTFSMCTFVWVWVWVWVAESRGVFEWHVPLKLAKWHRKYSLITTHLFVRESKLLTQDHKYQRNGEGILQHFQWNYARIKKWSTIILQFCRV